MAGVILCGDRATDTAVSQWMVDGLLIGGHTVAGVFIKCLIAFYAASLMCTRPHVEPFVCIVCSSILSKISDTVAKSHRKHATK